MDIKKIKKIINYDNGIIIIFDINGNKISENKCELKLYKKTIDYNENNQKFIKLYS